MDAQQLNEEQLQELYAWIDQVPLSRPKKNITRDFSDGVLVAEVVKHYIPKIVEIHNYIPANSTQQKISNWGTLNRKVFSKLNFHISDDIVRKAISNTPGVIEPVLYTLRQKIVGKLQDNPQERVTQQAKESEYYSTKTAQPIYGSAAALPPTQVKANYHPDSTGMTQTHTRRLDSNSQPFAHLDPRVRLLLEEKEQALLALQETVQILQMKVQRLEHLVQLKDLRIEDLTRHLRKK
ncbi:sperm flagellar protein 1-like [Bombina bombina]|uniref:sperm flagellar protein 1-like n=1 Tax=Bombina bombina TaxID=8345 RepID=UPI00235A7E72|nr:sperm flagellar protein 1-like [Bombina bombina]